MPKYDWIEPLRPSLVALKCVGLWPTEEFYKLNLYTLYTVLAIVLFIYCQNFFQIMNIFFIYDDLNALTGIFFVALSQFSAIVKSHFFIRHLRVLKKLMADVNSDIFQPKNDVQLRYAHEGIRGWKRLTRPFLLVAAGTMTFWAVYPILDRTYKQHRLPFLAWYPFRTDVSPFYELTYLHQVTAVSFIAVVNVFIDTFVSAVLTIIATQCDILCDHLRNLDGDVGKKLVSCILHHREILRFSENVNTFFDVILFAQFFTSTISIGLTMFQLTVVPAFSSEFYSFLFYGVAIALQTLMYCWFGNEMFLKSLMLSDAAYEFDWTVIPLGVRKNVLFFITRTQRPIKMTALNLFYLSLETFMTILRTAWSYFALLNTLNAK